MELSIDYSGPEPGGDALVEGLRSAPVFVA